jgi:hypothetical protein
MISSDVGSAFRFYKNIKAFVDFLSEKSFVIKGKHIVLLVFITLRLTVIILMVLKKKEMFIRET